MLKEQIELEFEKVPEWFRVRATRYGWPLNGQYSEEEKIKAIETYQGTLK